MKCRICDHNLISDKNKIKISNEKLNYVLEINLEKLKVCEECKELELHYIIGHIEKTCQILSTGKGNHKEVSSEVSEKVEKSKKYRK